MKIILISGEENTGKTTICQMLIKNGIMLYNLEPRRKINKVALIEIDRKLCLISSAGDLVECIEENKFFLDKAQKFIDSNFKNKTIDYFIFTARTKFRKNPIYKKAVVLANSLDNQYTEVTTNKVITPKIQLENKRCFYNIRSQL